MFRLDFQNLRLKIARAIQLHISADLRPAIISARNNIFPWDQKQLVDIIPFYQKQL